jgi:copper chaperone CopZ
MATTERIYTVHGMTCDHCVVSLTEEVSEISGVEAVEVDLGAGRLVVSGHGFSDADISQAVAEAGYEVRS